MAFKAPARRILVIKTRAIGDTVLLSGTLRVLRARKPYYKIDVLVRAPGGHLLECLPCVDRVICVTEPESGFERMLYWMRLIRRLRERRYEMVLNFHASRRTAFFAKLLRSQLLVSNNHDLKGHNWFSDVDVPGRGHVKSAIDRDLDVLRAIGIHVKPEEAAPEFHLNSIEKKWATDYFHDAEAAGKTGFITRHGPRIFLGIGGSRETKRWPPEYFAMLAERLAREHDACFVLVTVPEDEDWLQRFRALVCGDEKLKERVAFITGISLRHVGAVLSKCHLYVGNDYGVKHLAAAAGLSTFTFFGPELPSEWHPYDARKHPHAFIHGLACRTESGKHWCAIPTCPKHGHQCMRKIGPEDVYGKITALLARKASHHKSG